MADGTFLLNLYVLGEQYGRTREEIRALYHEFVNQKATPETTEALLDRLRNG